MDIINLLHSTFKGCQYFEFGEDFVRVYDVETKKYYQITVSEYQPSVKTPEKTILKGVQSIQNKKTTRHRERPGKGF